MFEKQEREDEQKRERKAKGREDLVRWNEERQKQIELRKKTNEEQERAYHEQVQVQRTGPNPWDRVVANCEMNSS